jgi:hypothetical protein
VFQLVAGPVLAGRGFRLWLMDMPGLAGPSSALVAERARCEARGIGQAMASESHKPNRFKRLHVMHQPSNYRIRASAFFSLPIRRCFMAVTIGKSEVRKPLTLRCAPIEQRAVIRTMKGAHLSPVEPALSMLVFRHKKARTKPGQERDIFGTRRKEPFERAARSLSLYLEIFLSTH